MPRRNTVLANGEYYHVFNRSLDSRQVFKNKPEKKRAVQNIWYYRFHKPSIPFSRYLNLKQETQINYHNFLVESPKIVEVLCYCLMSNHFHFLIKQLKDGGISTYLSNLQNSFTRYYNGKYKRRGALFLNQFKAVRIETDEQLLHVSRYIHLNPYTGYLVKSIHELEAYPWSSLTEYLDNQRRSFSLCSIKEILSFFQDTQNYRDFVLDQADYQRELDHIKHLTFNDE